MAEGTVQYGMPILTAAWPSGDFCLLAGGGGSSKTGIKNKMIAVKVVNGKLTDVANEVDFGGEFPFRTGLHPQSSDCVVSLGTMGAKHFVLDTKCPEPKIKEANGNSASRVLSSIEEIVCSIVFSKDGTLLCLGYEEGSFQVFAWPDMTEKMLCRVSKDSTQLLDVDMDPSAQAIVATLDNGVSELWSFGDGSPLSTLTKPELAGSQFSHCRFAPNEPKTLFSVHNTTRAGSFVTKWTANDDWVLRSTMMKKVDKNTVCSFAMSPRGDMFAVGTSEGDIKVFTTGSMLLSYSMQGAHMVFVTALSFQLEDSESPDRNVACLVSASVDHSARATVIKRRSEFSLRLSSLGSLLPFLVLLLVIVFFVMRSDSKGYISQEL